VLSDVEDLLDPADDGIPVPLTSCQLQKRQMETVIHTNSQTVSPNHILATEQQLQMVTRGQTNMAKATSPSCHQSRLQSTYGASNCKNGETKTTEVVTCR